MPLFAPLLANLTLLFSLEVSPMNPPLKTLAFTSSSIALTSKMHRLPPSRPPSSQRRMSLAVLLAGLYQGGYEIFATAIIDAAQRRPFVHP